MSKPLFQYTFDRSVPIEDVEGSLVLAILAAEALHGQSQVRLDAAHAMDLEQRTCVIDADTKVGEDLNRLFVGFLAREFGEDSFRVERREPSTTSETENVGSDQLGPCHCMDARRSHG